MKVTTPLTSLLPLIVLQYFAQFSTGYSAILRVWRVTVYLLASLLHPRKMTSSYAHCTVILHELFIFILNHVAWIILYTKHTKQNKKKKRKIWLVDKFPLALVVPSDVRLTLLDPQPWRLGSDVHIADITPPATQVALWEVQRRPTNSKTTFKWN